MNQVLLILDLLFSDGLYGNLKKRKEKCNINGKLYLKNGNDSRDSLKNIIKVALEQYPSWPQVMVNIGTGLDQSQQY